MGHGRESCAHARTRLTRLLIRFMISLVLQVSIMFAFGCASLIKQLQVAEASSTITEQDKLDLIGFASQKAHIILCQR